MLGRYGYAVRTATDSCSAIDEVARGGIDLVLMDIDLGAESADGITTAEQILANHDLPIVFLTNHAEPEYATRAQAVTAYGYLVKGTPDAAVAAHIEMAFQLATTRAALRREEERQRITIEAIGDAVIATDVAGCVTSMNSVAQQLVGCSFSKARGRPVSEVFAITDGRTGESMEDPIRKVIETGKSLQLSNHTELHACDGSIYQIADSATLIRDDAGRARGVVLVFRDETAKYKREQELRESESRFRTLFDCMAQGVVYHGADGTITHANKAASRLLGLSHGQLLGLDSMDPRWRAIHPDGTDFPGETHPAMVALSTGRAVEREVMGVYRPDSDDYVWLVVSAHPEFTNGDSAPFRVFATFEDITAAIDSEQNLAARARRIEHLRAVLHTVTGVNTLITNATDAERFVREVCRHIQNDRGYYAAWIVLTDCGGDAVSACESGLGSSFHQLRRLLHAGEYPACYLRALGSTGCTTIQDPATECPGCPLASSYGGRAAFSTRLEHQGIVFGVLSASIPAEFAGIDAERALFEQLADTIAYALHALRLKENEAKHVEQLRLHERITDSTEQTMAFLDCDLVYRAVNSTYARYFALPRQQIVGRSVRELIGEELFEETAGGHLRRALAGDTVAYEVSTAFPGAGERLMTMRYTPYRDSAGAIGGVIAVGTDITDQRRAEQRYRTLMDSITASAFILDRQWRHVAVNDAGCSYTGRTREELIGSRLHELFPGIEATEIFRVFSESMEEREYRHVESPFDFPDGRRGWYEIHVYPVPEGILCISHDVSRRKEDEERIRRLLREKDAFLAEIHHRVKNNINLIASLLSLQARKTAVPEAATALHEARGRLESMLRLYERLYHSEDYSRVQLGAYIEELSKSFEQTYGHGSVRIVTQVDEVSARIDSAIPVGIIANELITNAAKHAFPDGREGIIMVSLRRRGAGEIELSVADDGIGLPESLTVDEPTSFGLRLVHVLAAQIGGSVSTTRDHGTRFSVAFPADEQ